MKSVLMVIAPSQFRDEEYAEPRAVLESAGASVTTASMTPGNATGRFGLVAHATLSLSDATQSSWDAVVFVGGGGASVYFDDPDAHALARLVLERGGIVAAICIAPSILARAGMLGGVNATAFESRRDDLIAHGAAWTEAPVVVDGRVITANGPEAATPFGRALADALDLY